MKRFVVILLVVCLVLLPMRPLTGRAAGEVLTVSPTSGPPGTVFRVTGSVAALGPVVTVVVYTLVPNRAGGAIGAVGEVHVFEGPVPVPLSGDLDLALDSTAYAPGIYVVTIPQRPGQLDARFVVTVAPRALPATGGGWARSLRPR